MRTLYPHLQTLWRRSKAFFYIRLIVPVVAWWRTFLQKQTVSLLWQRLWSYLVHLFSWQTVKRNPARALSVACAFLLLCVCLATAYHEFLPAEARSTSQQGKFHAIARVSPTTTTPYPTPTSSAWRSPTTTSTRSVPPASTSTNANTGPGYTGPGYTGPGATTPTPHSYTVPPTRRSTPTPAPIARRPVTPVSVPTAPPAGSGNGGDAPTPAGGSDGGGTLTPTITTTPQPIADCPASADGGTTTTAAATTSDTPTAATTSSVTATGAPTETATVPVTPTTPTGTVVTATATPTAIVTATATPTAVAIPTATVTGGGSEGVPTLTQLSPVVSDAYATEDSQNVPNSWGAQKSRFIRTASGDLFTVYIAAGSGTRDREWRLMHETLQGSWEQLQCGDAGTEPVNLILGAHDSIHLFTWPGTQGILHHLVSTDLGKTMKDEIVPGTWDASQGYSSVGVNASGDMVVLETGADKPGVFLWSYFDARSATWSFHSLQLDYRYTYAFLFPGQQHDLTIVGMRDVLRPELGYAPASGDFNYIFNQIDYFYIKDATNPTSVQQVKVASEEPQSTADAAITYLTDSYMDTQGRTHILYNDQYKGPFEAIVENGQVIKNVPLNGIDSGRKMRMTQDTTGRFYIIATSSDGNTLNVYRGTTDDSDGTHFAAATQLDISSHASCNDYDLCHEPTFTVPRSGNALSDLLDGVYGNNGEEIYFQIKLREQ